jgi:hypothetical protein
MPLEDSTEFALSVIVVILGGGPHVPRCLEALRRQENAAAMEVIVPYDDRRAEIAALREKFSEVNFVHVPGERTYAELRTAGVKASRGRIVAITEDQCIPPPRWCANIIEAHRAPHAAIGGPVDKLTPDSPLNWAIYLRELGTFMPPMAEGSTHALTDCNVTYKRATLEAIASVWAHGFHEPEVHAALAKYGESAALWLSPALLTMQQRTLELGPALAERYEFGRLYGGLRAAAVSPGKRIALILLSPLLPFLLVARVVLGVLRKHRHIGACLAALPYITLFAVVWAWGEFVGYLTKRAK